MAIITNFDELMSLRTEAARCGVGSKAWIEFATVMFYSFPALYETAKSMNQRLADQSEHPVIRRDVDLLDPCLKGRIENAIRKEQGEKRRTGL